MGDSKPLSWGEANIKAVKDITTGTATGVAKSIQSTVAGTTGIFTTTKEGVTGAYDKATGAFSKAYSSAANNLPEKVTDAAKKNEMALLEAEWTSALYKQEAELFEIGRPCKFNPTVDESGRFSNYLRNKMNAIDLIPVDYTIDFSLLLE